MDLETKIDILLEEYGLELLMLQNDITEEMLLKRLIENGWIDLQEYFLNDDTFIPDME